MKSIFEKANYEELERRLQSLTATSKSLWGKMNVAQMLHHLNLTMEAPMGKYKTIGKPVFFMKIFKSVLYNDKPFGKSAPTPKDYKIKDSFNFDIEKQKAFSNLKEIYERGLHASYLPHVFFGNLTNEQWGQHFYKHTDHHLKQFGL